MSSSDESTSSDSEIDELARAVFVKTIKSKRSAQEQRKFLDNRGNSGKIPTQRKVIPYESKTDSKKDKRHELNQQGERELYNIDKTDQKTSSILGGTIDVDKCCAKSSSDSESEHGHLSHRKKSRREENTSWKGSQEETKNENTKRVNLSSRIECSISIEDGYIQNFAKRKRRSDGDVDVVPRSHQFKMRDEEIMKKSVITPDFEKNFAIPPSEESLRQQKKQRKAEREKTKGKGWYNLPAPEMTEERKNDLEVLQMRKALDPKRFYKKTDIRALPKYFQFGTVIESSADFYHSRIPKKQRKSNMVQELLADAEFRKYNKRKYVEIQEAKMKGEGPYQRIKRMKRKKKKK